MVQSPWRRLVAGSFGDCLTGNQGMAPAFRSEAGVASSAVWLFFKQCGAYALPDISEQRLSYRERGCGGGLQAVGDATDEIGWHSLATGDRRNDFDIASRTLANATDKLTTLLCHAELTCPKSESHPNPMLRGREVKDITELRRQGLTISQIGAVTGFDRKTIRKYLNDPTTPHYVARKKRDSKLDAFKLSNRCELSLTIYDRF